MRIYSRLTAFFSNRRCLKLLLFFALLLLTTVVATLAFGLPIDINYVSWKMTASLLPTNFSVTFPKFLRNVSSLHKSTTPSFQTELQTSRPTREEKHHVAFVKVHKAASTTMQNIFLRHAMAHDLNVLLRKSSLHIGENSNRIPRYDLFKVPAGSKYDILCNHLIFDYNQVSSLFPNDTIYVGIVREPFSQFLSAFIYYSQLWHHEYLLKPIRAHPENPIEELLNRTAFYLRGLRPENIQVNNRMSVDFGFPLENFEDSKQNRTKITHFLHQLNATFDIILVAEMFDESLVLLRRMLGWTTKDIIYMDKNVFNTQNKKDEAPWITRKDYSDHVHLLFKKWAAIDISLYNYFHGILKERIRLQPPDFFQEVLEFKSLKPKIVASCRSIMQGRDNFVRMHFPATKHCAEFFLTPTDCELMSFNENKLTDTAKHVQKLRYDRAQTFNKS